MKETKMFEAVIITGSGVEILRVSNSKKLLNDFIKRYIHIYVSDFFGERGIKILREENCYTILEGNNDFVAAFKIRSIVCMVASPEELEEEKRETEKTAKNAE